MRIALILILLGLLPGCHRRPACLLAPSDPLVDDIREIVVGSALIWRSDIVCVGFSDATEAGGESALWEQMLSPPKAFLERFEKPDRIRARCDCFLEHSRYRSEREGAPARVFVVGAVTFQGADSCTVIAMSSGGMMDTNWVEWTMHRQGRRCTDAFGQHPDSCRNE